MVAKKENTHNLKPLIEVKDIVNTVESPQAKPKKPKPVKFTIDPPVYINGIGIYGDYVLGGKIPLGKNRASRIIDEALMKNLLARAALARTQEERVYKNQGMSMTVDPNTGIIKTTRKM